MPAFILLSTMIVKAKEQRHTKQLEIKPTNDRHSKHRLRTFCAYCFCASLLRTQFTCQCHATSCIMHDVAWHLSACAVVLAGILISMHGLISLKCSVTRDFLLIDHFHHRLSTFCEKLKKTCVAEAWIFSNFCPRIIRYCYYFSCTVLTKAHLKGWV